ncbi:unnamed protein product [Caenorhabditis bovis]|uniref:C-type lectin domain-containing protein n=1 Tax=Caenorhabditis bovis TaxID=2654633 RepID=A0A8S1EP41_9PELO|nr:unnamed protein product [Caenorhabditis bovis]
MCEEQFKFIKIYGEAVSGDDAVSCSTYRDKTDEFCYGTCSNQFTCLIAQMTDGYCKLCHYQSKPHIIKNDNQIVYIKTKMTLPAFTIIYTYEKTNATFYRFSCADRWNVYTRKNGQKIMLTVLQFGDDVYSRDEAAKRCHYFGAELGGIESSQELVHAQSFFSPSVGSVWAGAQRKPDAIDEYEWTDSTVTGTEMIKWDDGYPKGFDCLVIDVFTEKVQDRPCIDDYNVIPSFLCVRRVENTF